MYAYNRALKIHLVYMLTFLFDCHSYKVVCFSKCGSCSQGAPNDK